MLSGRLSLFAAPLTGLVRCPSALYGYLLLTDISSSRWELAGAVGEAAVDLAEDEESEAEEDDDDEEEEEKEEEDDTDEASDSAPFVAVEVDGMGDVEGEAEWLVWWPN